MREFAIGQPFNPYKRFNGIHIPEALCRYRGLSAGAKLVYGRLARFAGKNGKVYPSVAKLAAELGVSPKQARRYVRELEDGAFIRPARTPGKSSQYDFLWHPAFEGETGAQRKQRYTPPEDGSLRESVVLRESSSRESGEESQARHSNKAAAFGATSGKNPKPKPPSKILADDDSKPFPNESPEARLKAWAKNRGDALSQRDWWAIKAEAETRGLGLSELADLAEKNNGNWNSSGAGLRWLVKNYASKSVDAPEEKPIEQPKPKCGRCGASNGRGVILDGDRFAACPDCSTPEWPAELGRQEAERIERRKKVAA